MTAESTEGRNIIAAPVVGDRVLVPGVVKRVRPGASARVAFNDGDELWLDFDDADLRPDTGGRDLTALLRVWHDLDEGARELVEDEIPELASELDRAAGDVAAPDTEPSITVSAEWVRQLFESAQYTICVPPIALEVEWLVRDLHKRVTKLVHERSELEKRLAELRPDDGQPGSRARVGGEVIAPASRRGESDEI